MSRRFRWLPVGILSAGAVLTLSFGSHITAALASDGRSGEVRILKNCNNFNGMAGTYCTITSSNLAAIPAGTTVFYDQAAGTPAGMLDSNVVLSVKTGDWAVGRCTLDGNTGLGLCTFSDGVGSLAGFQARVAVAPAPGANNFSWAGRYHFAQGN